MSTSPTSGWTCPACRRRFARNGQSHECAPAMELEEYFSTGPPFERPIFDAVMAHVATVGPVILEPVSVGVFVKHPDGSRFIELRPMTRWTALSFQVSRRIDSARISRKPIPSGARWFHVVNLSGPEDVDDVVRAWLTEAYLS